MADQPGEAVHVLGGHLPAETHLLGDQEPHQGTCTVLLEHVYFLWGSDLHNDFPFIICKSIHHIKVLKFKMFLIAVVPCQVCWCCIKLVTGSLYLFILWKSMNNMEVLKPFLVSYLKEAL